MYWNDTVFNLDITLLWLTLTWDVLKWANVRLFCLFSQD